MLSRVADSLYWMSRYLERAEHTARLLSVGLTQTLGQQQDAVRQRWLRLLAALHVMPPTGSDVDMTTLAQAQAFDAENRDALVNNITLARENARQVREQISTEMWEQLNRLYLHVRTNSSLQLWQDEPIEFFQSVKEGAHLFQGITDATMSHGEGWHFIQVGRFLERAGATALLLDTHFQPYLAATRDEPSPLEFNDWVALLKCCTAFEAYCKVYTADVQPTRVAEFLLLNGESPRSVRFAADRIQRSLQAIAQATASRGVGRAERLAGRLRAALDYGQVDEILADDMHGSLSAIRRSCDGIHAAIYQTYVVYPVESALTV